MRTKFPGYYRLTDKEIEHLWNQAIFVFDTNVLLNLYSYPEAVREVFFSVLNKISNRIWIPYHVGIEFHRNKFARIKQANQRLYKLLSTIEKTSDELNLEVKNVELEKRNIGIDDLQARLKAVEDAHKKLSEAVKLACEKLPSISLQDEIGDQISSILLSQIGDPPENQKSLDDLISDGIDRYAQEIPPGFSDAKEKGETTFRDRNITYYRKFGDLILWKQLLNHTKNNNLKNIIFVTGDRKKDWWWIDEGRTLGPLPDLVQEITFNGGVDLFWMYTSDQFLEYSQIHLQAKEVTDEAIAQVKEITESDSIDSYKEIVNSQNDISDAMKLNNWYDYFAFAGKDRPVIYKKNLSNIFDDNSEASYVSYDPEAAVIGWLNRMFPSADIVRQRVFPDIVLNNGDLTEGYEVKQLSSFEHFTFPPYVINSLLRGYWELNEGRLSRFTLVLVLPNDYPLYFPEDWVNEAKKRLRGLLAKYSVSSIILGRVQVDHFEPIVASSREH